jgi:hypothetical protein
LQTREVCEQLKRDAIRNGQTWTSFMVLRLPRHGTKPRASARPGAHTSL